jgi:CRISPR/Cas system-associated protein endoribonuclease Cas2
VAFAIAVGIYVPVDSAADKQSARKFKQSLLGNLGNSQKKW